MERGDALPPPVARAWINGTEYIPRPEALALQIQMDAARAQAEEIEASLAVLDVVERVVTSSVPKLES